MVKEKLKEYFKKNKQSVSINELAKTLKLTAEEKNVLVKNLYELEKEGNLIYTADNKYLPVAEDFYLQHGIVKQSNKGRIYVDIGNGMRVHLSDKFLEKVATGDTVYVKKKEEENSKHNKYHEGDIVRIVKEEENNSSSTLIKGVLERDYESNRLFLKKDNHKYYVTPSKTASAYPFDTVTILVNNNTKEIEVKDIIKRKHDKHVFECSLKNGVKCWMPVGTEYFEIEEKPKDDDLIGKRVLASLSKDKDKYSINIEKEIKGQSKMEKVITSSLLEHGFSDTFSSKALHEASKAILKTDNYQRRDLRNLETFTIDSYHAKDLDDAISLVKEKNGFTLYVSIADVSFYVRPEMQLFEEALNKTTSVYPANQVSPMLPSILSNGVCSLNPNEDKYALTLKVVLDNMGNSKDFELFPSIIRSDLKMSYQKVDDLLLGKDKPFAYLPHYETLTNMYCLANLLQNKRLEKGMLGLEDVDINFDIDDLGNPLSISERARGPATLIIENFMLLANQTVADFAYYLGIPFVYRNHEGPSFAKKKNLESDLHKIDKRIRHIPNIDDPIKMQQFFLTVTKGKTEEEIKILSEIFIKNFQRAYYSEQNIGHYGLVMPRYATFTSPIRRSSDLLNHLFLNEVLRYNGHDVSLDEIKKNLSSITEHLSVMQEEQEQVENEVNFYLLKKYSKEFNGMVLPANLNFLREDMAYLKTDNLIPGIINKSSRYQINTTAGTLYDKKIDKLYHIGDRVDVEIKDKSSNKNQIVFDLVEKEKILIKK